MNDRGQLTSQVRPVSPRPRTSTFSRTGVARECKTLNPSDHTFVLSPVPSDPGGTSVSRFTKVKHYLLWVLLGQSSPVARPNLLTHVQRSETRPSREERRN